MKPERTKRSRSEEPRRDDGDRQTHEIERLKQENERLRQQIAEQAKRIADLEHQLALRQQNSTTTSKPPSSDGLAGRQRDRGRRVKSRRKGSIPDLYAEGWTKGPEFDSLRVPRRHPWAMAPGASSVTTSVPKNWI